MKRIARALIALILLPALAACDAEPPTPTPKPTIANAVAPTAEIDPVLPTPPGNTPIARLEFTPGFNYTVSPPAATAPSQALNIPLSDAVLSATYYRSSAKEPGTVILLHGANHDSTIWLDVPVRLQSAGLNVIALDLRGAGRSSGQADWARAEADMSDVLEYLRGLKIFDANRVAYVGLEGGAAVAISACAADSVCRGVVAISPKAAGKIELNKVIPALGKRPLLLIGAENEPLKPLRDLATGEGTLQQFPGAGGAELIVNNADMVGIIAAWLVARV
jgi:pimeloyl-ACP methyl ester carboxylesterase